VATLEKSPPASEHPPLASKVDTSGDTNTVSHKPQGFPHPGHYASLGEMYGTDERLNGSGCFFRAKGERKATLVSSKDPTLLLPGRCDLADAQRAADEAASGFPALARGSGKER
jgi:hypothetical protein